MKLVYQFLHSSATAPVRATKQSSCYDVHAVEGGAIAPGGRALLRTGLKVAVQLNALERFLIAIGLKDAREIQVRPRSGLARKQGITVLNAPGTVDGDYREELGVILINHGDAEFKFSSGDRIAQIGIYPVRICGAEQVDDISDPGHRKGGFGSTGVGKLPQ